MLQKRRQLISVSSSASSSTTKNVATIEVFLCASNNFAFFPPSHKIIAFQAPRPPLDPLCSKFPYRAGRSSRRGGGLGLRSSGRGGRGRISIFDDWCMSTSRGADGRWRDGGRIDWVIVGVVVCTAATAIVVSSLGSFQFWSWRFWCFVDAYDFEDASYRTSFK